MNQDFLLFSGTGNPSLTHDVAAQLGVPVGACAIGRFPDGEVDVRLEEPVRGREVFVMQPTGPPVNDSLIELLAFADACSRAGAARLTAVMPYFGYARSDKRHGRREPITASLVAQLIQAAGIDEVLTLDLHTTQIEGFFGIPLDDLTAVPTLCRALPARACRTGSWSSHPTPGGSPWLPTTRIASILQSSSCISGASAGPRHM